MIDAFASEQHFADHLYAVWKELDDPGDFIVDTTVYETGTAHRWPGSVSQASDPSRPVLVASYGDHKRMRRQGRSRIARMEHGAGQSYGTGHGSYAGGNDCDDVGLFLTPNRYSADLWQNAYPRARVEIVGCPKLDTLPRKEAPGRTVAISFHWDCHLLPETVSAFGHFRSALEDLRDRFDLIGHGHPRAFTGPPMLHRRYRRAGINDVVTDFAEVCRRADLLICDNSSALYEFAVTGRPVVVLNSPSYRRDVHHGLRFWDAVPGIAVDQPRDLVAAVTLALDDPPELQATRESALDKVYAYRSGAARRAAQALREWAS